MLFASIVTHHGLHWLLLEDTVVSKFVLNENGHPTWDVKQSIVVNTNLVYILAVANLGVTVLSNL